MPFSSLRAHLHVAHVAPARDNPTAYSEDRAIRLRLILDGGGWTIHDVVNSERVRDAVSEQWRLLHRMEQDHAVEGYINYLEYLEVVSHGRLPRPSRPPYRSLFSF